jgi:hypothetical protein
VRKREEKRDRRTNGEETEVEKGGDREIDKESNKDGA